MAIKLIYATNIDRIMGRNGRLPWYIPEDLKHFQQLTVGCPVIMGSRTWESLPGKQRPLKNRMNIVLTRNEHVKYPGAIIKHSLEEALQEAKTMNSKDIWIIGGANVLKQSMKLAETLHVTVINNKISGDVKSPVIDLEVFKLTHQEPMRKSGMYNYQFLTYNKK